MKNLDLTVKFHTNQCLIVPKEAARNADTLKLIGQFARDAQMVMDRIATSGIEQILDPSTPAEEVALFKTLEELNAEIILRMLVMRRLVTEGLVKR